MKKSCASDFRKADLVALLDTQPEVGNHSVPFDRMPDIVFDHHFPRELSGPEPPFFDVGGEFGATSTKLVGLALASGLEIPDKLATALVYGVKSDTFNLSREATPYDFAAYMHLLPLADSQILAEIEHPQLPVKYFRIFNKAIQRGKIHGNVVVADLGEIYTPDLCAEVADRLLHIEGVRHALAVGWYEEALFLSLRSRNRNKKLGKLLHGIIVQELKLGTAGGHTTMAGARIPVEGKSQRARADVRRKVVSKILAAFGQDYRHFSRLISRKEAALSSIDPPPPKSPATSSKGQNGEDKNGDDTKRPRTTETRVSVRKTSSP